MHWAHSHLLTISDLTADDIHTVFELADRFVEMADRPVKKAPTLKGKSVLLFFAEPSTRTKTSFDIAAKRLSADTFSLAQTGSSLQKGENLKDTALTLQAMHPDALVIRHSMSGAAHYLSQILTCKVINAGDGWHAHPTQALLDGFTLYQVWSDFAGKTLLLLGDIAHSRVARSDVELFYKLGVHIRVCAPRTLLPRGIDNWPVQVFTDPVPACTGVDAIQCLRLQLERQSAGLLPSLREYAQFYGLRSSLLDLAQPGVKVLHPGPVNRGIEIQSSLADAGNSLILTQVSAGVAVRMALLYLFLTQSQKE
ncbi:MAG: aspartate carbamoyltransferase catalytic subunit [Desulfovermiculus sp.]